MTAEVRPLSAQPGRRSIVVFPHAGGSPRFYAPWSKLLPAQAGLYGVTYPGRDALVDYPVADRLVDLASDCAEQLDSLARSSEVMVMFGHSMGSYVAFETIRALERSGTSISAFTASGANAPHRMPVESWHRASDDDLVAHVVDVDATSREAFAIPELRRMLLPVIRQDFRLVETYRADGGAQVSCPIHIFNGAADTEVSPTDTEEWQVCTRAGWRSRTYPGGHFYVRESGPEIVADLLAVLLSAGSD